MDIRNILLHIKLKVGVKLMNKYDIPLKRNLHNSGIHESLPQTGF